MVKERKCFKCGSTKIIKQVSTLVASMPEIKEQIMAGTAEISHKSFQSGVFYRCDECGFGWDSMVERQLEADRAEREAKETEKNEK